MWIHKSYRIIVNYPDNLHAWSVVPLIHVKWIIVSPLTSHFIFVLVSSCRESLLQRCFSPPFFPTRRKSLSGTPWIKIAGAILRTHDIGENATEALIMADTRRAVAATTFYPLTQDSHYTNVPPIIGPQSEVPPRGTLPARPSITSIRIMQTDEKIKFLDPAWLYLRRYDIDFCETRSTYSVD